MEVQGVIFQVESVWEDFYMLRVQMKRSGFFSVDINRELGVVFRELDFMKYGF